VIKKERVSNERVKSCAGKGFEAMGRRKGTGGKRSDGEASEGQGEAKAKGKRGRRSGCGGEVSEGKREREAGEGNERQKKRGTRGRRESGRRTVCDQHCSGLSSSDSVTDFAVPLCHCVFNNSLCSLRVSELE
jgi:hypothetical protein